MLLHRDIALNEISHGRGRDAQQVFRRCVDQFLGGSERWGELAKEHGTIHGEMQIMRAVHRINVKRTFTCQELPVRDYAALIIDQYIVIIAAEDIDMGRHIHQMPGIRHHVAEVDRPPEVPVLGNW